MKTMSEYKLKYYNDLNEGDWFDDFFREVDLSQVKSSQVELELLLS